MKTFVPDSPLEIFRAMFDLPSPYADGSMKYNYEADRVYVAGSFYIPHFIYQLIITLNIALVSTIIGTAFAFVLCFFASTNLVGAGLVRWVVRRVMEILRAFPEIVVAGLLTAILSIGPIAAIIAISVHTIGALGKLFFEVVENADMKADEGLRAAGASWLERVRFAIVPQVLPNFVSYALLRAEINVRASTIIGAVGGGGIGEVFRLSIGNDHAAKTYAIIILLLITIIAVDQFSGWLRRRLIGHQSFEFGRGAA
jgi:phosphonate transport system permease protein